MWISDREALSFKSTFGQITPFIYLSLRDFSNLNFIFYLSFYWSIYNFILCSTLIEVKKHQFWELYISYHFLNLYICISVYVLYRVVYGIICIHPRIWYFSISLCLSFSLWLALSLSPVSLSVSLSLCLFPGLSLTIAVSVYFITLHLQNSSPVSFVYAS